ncbi:MAG TPA: ankyrin repeat domain-containing protein [Labilithrix sp.]|nr:ankyrin repeat domain-containing protein [Labilithrix sp.]
MSFGRLASIVRERADLLSRALLAVAQVAAIGWFSPGRGLPLDDAWIHQVVGRTFANTGTLGYAPGEHGAAATSYLWAALLAVNFKIPLLEPTRWALLLNGLAALATGQLLHSLLLRARPEGIDRRDWRWTSLATTLLASNSPNLLWFTCSGMEAMPFVALSLAAIWASTHDEERPRLALLAGVAAGALALLRPEAAPLGGLLAAHALVRRRLRSLVPLAAPWLSCVALYVVSNVAKTGHAVPSTLSGRRWLWFEMSAGLSRVDRALDFLDAWTTRLGSYTFDTTPAVVWILVALAAYGALRLVRGRSSISQDGPRLLVAWSLFHAAFYVLLLPTPGHGGRYQPLTPLLFAACLPIGAAFVLRELAKLAGAADKPRFGWFAALGMIPWIALGAPVLGSLRHANALAVAHVQGTELGAGAFIDALPEGAVASFDIGGTGYASRRPVLDLGGLSDPQTAELLASGRIATWLEAHDVRWIVLPQSYEPVLPLFEDYRSRLHIAENPSIVLEPVRTFETKFDKWDPAIRATWNAAPKQVVYEVHYTHRPGPPEVAAVAPEVRREIADPARLVPTRERVVAEHMLAVLAAWELPIDVHVTPAPPASSTIVADATEGAAASESAAEQERSAGTETNLGGPCAIRIGWWGIAVDGCASVGGARVVRAATYEHAGRYLDMGDLGGAIRVLPHVVAQLRRRVDPRFHPPLAPLMPPIPGGVFLSPMRAGGFGLALFGAVLGLAFAIEIAARRNARLSRLIAFVRARAAALPATALLALAVAILPSCRASHEDDVARAISRGRGAVEVAIANGGSVDQSQDGRRTPLLEAAAAGDAEVLSLLVSKGARLDVVAPDGATALHLAARRGQHAAVAIIAAAMAGHGDAGTLHAPAGPRRRTALHDAALSGSVDTVALLLRAGSDPKRADSFGQTPLHLLAIVDPPRAAAIAPLLVDAGADVATPDARGFTAVHAAAVHDNLPLVRVLLDSVKVDATKAEAVDDDHTSTRRRLLDVRTPLGETALDLALRYGRDRAAEGLLQAGARPSRENAWLPLHQAARMDAAERTASLLAISADTDRRVHGKTALDIAVQYGSKRVEALLQSQQR